MEKKIKDSKVQMNENFTKSAQFFKTMQANQ